MKKQSFLILFALMIPILLFSLGVTIIININNDDIRSGSFNINGSFQDLDNIHHVALTINDGPWENADGTNNWNYTVDYRNLVIEKEVRFDPVTWQYNVFYSRGVVYGEIDFEVAAFDEYNSILASDNRSIVIIPESPVSDRLSGFYGDDVEMTLTAKPEVEIFYTVNGDDPKTYGILYTAPLYLTETTTVKTIARSENGFDSELTEITIDIDKTAAPTFNIEYFEDIELTQSMGNDPLLKAGTYYLKITSSKDLLSEPQVVINAEGINNDILYTDFIFADEITSKIYVHERTIIEDIDAIGAVREDVAISGTDLVGQESNQVDPLNENSNSAFTDTTPPSIGYILVNDLAGYTSDNTPLIDVSSDSADFMRFALEEADLPNSSWVNYADLYDGVDISIYGDGSVTIWVEFKDIAGNIQSTHASDDTNYDSNGLSFDIEYFADASFDQTLGNNPYLNEGTYYLKISTNKIVTDPLYISIDAEGANNDVNDILLTKESDYVYHFIRVITQDNSAAGSILESVLINGIVPSNSLLKSAYTDTTLPEINMGSDIAWTNQPATIDPLITEVNIDSYYWSKIDGSGDITFSDINTENVTVDGALNIEVSYTIQLLVTDKAGNTNTSTLLFNWDTQAPIVNAGDDINWTNEVVQLSGNATDTVGVSSTTWSVKSGIGTVEFSDINSLTSNINGVDDEEESFEIKLTAADNLGNTGSDTLIFYWDKLGPVVNAGDDIPLTNQTQNLNGIASDNVGIQSTIWSKENGTGTVYFDDTSSLTSSIYGTEGEEEIFVIKLTAEDNLGNINSDTLTFNWDKKRPIVNAGSDIAWTNQSQTLNGSVSDPNGIYMSFWIKENSDDQVYFGDEDSMTSTIYGDDGFEETYVITLYAEDDAGNDNSDDLIFNWDKKGPTVNAGDDIAWTNTTTQLNGSATDNRGISSTLWSKESGSGTVEIISPASLTSNIIGPDGTEESYEIKLTAKDNLGNSSSDTLVFNWDKKAPVVNAGPDIDWTNQVTTINGSATDLSGIAIYYWEKISGNGDLSIDNVNSSTINVEGQDNTMDAYELKLTATDLVGNSANDDAIFKWDKVAPKLIEKNAIIDWATLYPLINRDHYDASFINETTGWLAGESSTYKITNAGENWDAQINGDSDLLNAVHFIDEKEGWAVGNNKKVIHTSDGGNTWELVNINTIATKFYCVEFVSKDVGWIGGDNGVLLRTIDGGNTWSLDDPGFANDDIISELYFNSDGTGWFCTSKGNIGKKLSGSNTFNLIYSSINYSFTSLFFVNNEIGWIIGIEESSYDGLILKSENGGSSWNLIYYDSNYSFKDIFFEDQNHGWALYGTRELKKTRDGGITWTDHILPNIIGTDPREIIITDDYGYIFGKQTSTVPSVYRSNYRMKKVDINNIGPINQPLYISYHLDNPEELTYHWEKIIGDGDLVFSSSNSNTSKVTVNSVVEENYSIKFSATDNAGNVYLDVIDFAWINSSDINVKSDGIDLTSDSSIVYFENSELWSTNNETDIAIENMYPSNLNISNIFLSNGNIGEFEIDISQTNMSILQDQSTTFTVSFIPTSIGIKSAVISIESNDPDENPFTFTVQGTGIPGSEINIKNGVVDILNQTGSFDFGDVPFDNNKQSVFTVENNGLVELNLSGDPLIQIEGENADQFSVISYPDASIESNGTSDFITQFDPTSSGLKTATIKIDNNDADEGAYTFTITGNAFNYTMISSYNQWQTDNLSTTSEIDWFYFDATADEEFHIHWDENNSGSGLYSGRIIVSAFNHDISSNFFNQISNGYSVPQIINTTTHGRIFLKVEVENSTAGTYAIKVGNGKEMVVNYDSNMINSNYNYDYDLVSNNSDNIVDFSIENIGVQDLTVNNITLSDPVNFTYDLSSTTIAPGTTEILSVNCNTSTIGNVSTLLTIESNDPTNSTFHINLSAEVVDVQTLTLNNWYPDELVVAGEEKWYSFDAQNGVQYKVFGDSLGDSGNYTADYFSFNVYDQDFNAIASSNIHHYTDPTIINADYNGKIYIKTSCSFDHIGTYAIRVTNAPFLSVSTSLTGELYEGENVHIGATIINEPKTPEQFTIKNTGYNTLSISNITIEDSNNFVLTQVVDSTLSLNEETTFLVQLSPIVSGELNTVVTVYSNDLDYPVFTIDIEAVSWPNEEIANMDEWHVATATFTSYHYQHWFYFEANADEEYYIQMDNGTEGTGTHTAYVLMNIYDSTRTNPFAENISYAYDDPILIKPNENGNINIKFDEYFDSGTYAIKVYQKPIMKVYLDDLTIDNGDAISIDRVPTNYTKDFIFKIKNEGYKQLELTDDPLIRITGSHASEYIADYSMTNTILQPNETTTFKVTFAPVGEGTIIGYLKISSNDIDDPLYEIDLFGYSSALDISGTIEWRGYDDNGLYGVYDHNTDQIEWRGYGDNGLCGVYDHSTGLVEWRGYNDNGIYQVYDTATDHIDWRGYDDNELNGVYDPNISSVVWRGYDDNGLYGVYNPEAGIVEWRGYDDKGLCGVYNFTTKEVEWRGYESNGLFGVYVPNYPEDYFIYLQENGIY